MQGFAELEYGILRWMGAIDDSTLVVTTGTVAFECIECYLRFCSSENTESPERVQVVCMVFKRVVQI